MHLIETQIVTNEACAGDYRLLALEAPQICAKARPGQFIHMRIPRLEDALLRRPFSIFKAEKDTITILYKTVGKGTWVLADIPPGEPINLLGPLGNGFPKPSADKLPVLIAGGYGVAPLCFLAKTIEGKGLIFIGGASKTDILCLQDFQAMGWEIHVTTEDGSMGDKGLVTSVLDSWLTENEDAVPEFFACGPDGMLKAVADRAQAKDADAWLSLDKHMGCGVGACLACVQRLRSEDGSESWGRVCKDGPVFNARQIIWE